MFNIFEKAKKSSFEMGYKIGYKVGRADGEQCLLETKLNAYNMGYHDGLNSETKKALDIMSTLKERNKNVRKK